VLFFDDLKENIDAAAALGWQCVHIDHTTDTAAQIRRGVAGAGIPLPE
jgi:FMN phosphatase YigB (HAD superfamily)